MSSFQKNVLLVEDEPAHAEMVIRNFSGVDGIKLVHVENGQQALDYLFRRHEFSDPAASPFPSLVLLDLRLPKVSGMEVLEVIKSNEKLCRIPVIILSTSDADHDMQKAYGLHANSYLAKPFDYAEFSKMMKSVSDYWLVLNKVCQADEVGSP